MADLPLLIGLCPGEHLHEFYMPLGDGDSTKCPSCERDLAIYALGDDVDRRVRSAYEAGREDAE